MPGRWPWVPGCALGLLGFTSCCLEPAAGVRLQQPVPGASRFLFYPLAEGPDGSELLGEMKVKKRRHRAARAEGEGDGGEEPPKTRLLLGKWRAGFDDTLSRLITLMRLAMAANARLVLPAPAGILERNHGNISFVAEWWDEYFEAEPAFYRREKRHQCPKHTKKQFWNTSRLESEIRLGNASILFDRSQAFCVQLRGDWRYKSILDAPAMVSAMQSVGRNPRLYVSSKIAQYADRVAEELGQSFSAVHVRQGDMGAPVCTSPKFVSDVMASQGRTDKWFVASNGNSSWFEELLANASGMRMDVVTEQQQTSLASLQDNYFRYGVEKCMFSIARHFVDTYHNSGFGCMPVMQKTHKRRTHLLCPEGVAA